MMVQSVEGEALFKVPGVATPCVTWYKVIGDLEASKQTPLILLHGGPAACHEYLADHAKLTSDHGIPVVLYDQIGNGKSTHLRSKIGDESFWTLDLFCAELDNLVDSLGIRDRGFDILGQSWGGILAGEYAVRQPRGLKRIIMYSTAAAIGDLNKDIALLINELPMQTRDTIKAGKTETEEYKQALGEFFATHMCRIKPFPAPELLPGFHHMEADSTVYSTMWGPSEVVVSGAIRNWSITDRLHLITQPVLMINGEFDQANVHCSEGLFWGLKTVKSVTISGASHMSHLEQPAKYWAAVSRFLLKRERLPQAL